MQLQKPRVMRGLLDGRYLIRSSRRWPFRDAGIVSWSLGVSPVALSAPERETSITSTRSRQSTTWNLPGQKAKPRIKKQQSKELRLSILLRKCIPNFHLVALHEATSLHTRMQKTLNRVEDAKQKSKETAQALSRENYS